MTTNEPPTVFTVVCRACGLRWGTEGRLGAPVNVPQGWVLGQDRLLYCVRCRPAILRTRSRCAQEIATQQLALFHELPRADVGSQGGE